jgi:hypothetical protein
MQQTSHHAIEEVENSTDDNEEQCQLGIALESPVGSYTS